MSAAHQVETLLAQLGAHRVRRAVSREETPDAASPPILRLGWPGVEALLPDGGLPRGVVELTSPNALGGCTAVALAAVRAGQNAALSGNAKPEALRWCAWLDPEGTLHAPGVVASGVSLDHLFVAFPPRASLGRVAVKVVSSGAFSVVVIDIDPVPLAEAGGASGRRRSAGRVQNEPASSSAKRRAWAPEVLVRKLALAAESSGATVLLLTNKSQPRGAAWPVALRLELHRPSRSELAIRVAKDRRGRIGPTKTVSFDPSAFVPLPLRALTETA